MVRRLIFFPRDLDKGKDMGHSFIVGNEEREAPRRRLPWFRRAGPSSTRSLRKFPLFPISFQEGIL